LGRGACAEAGEETSVANAPTAGTAPANAAIICLRFIAIDDHGQASDSCRIVDFLCSRHRVKP